MPATPLTVPQGSTFTMKVFVKDNLGAPINLTGFTVRMQVREAYQALAAVLSLTSSPAAGIVITSAVGGEIDFTITDEQSAGLRAPFVYVYDAEIESASGVVTRILEGTLTTTPEVTRG